MLLYLIWQAGKATLVYVIDQDLVSISTDLVSKWDLVSESLHIWYIYLFLFFLFYSFSFDFLQFFSLLFSFDFLSLSTLLFFLKFWFYFIFPLISHHPFFEKGGVWFTLFWIHLVVFVWLWWERILDSCFKLLTKSMCIFIEVFQIK